MRAWRWGITLALGIALGALFLARGIECGSSVRNSTHDDRSSFGHGAYKRDLSNPLVAHIVGSVAHEGHLASGATIEATVYPTGMGWTIDTATSAADGGFSIPITSNHLEARQVVELRVTAGLLRGHATVLIAPGETLRNVRIQVGLGLTIRGRVTNAVGAAPKEFDGRPVGVCLAWSCGEVGPDGAFELKVFELGRHRLQVIGGGVTHSVKELPLRKVAPKIVVDRLVGVLDAIELTIDQDAADLMETAPSWAESKDAGTVRVRVVATRASKLPSTVMCMTGHGGNHIPVGDGREPIVVPVLRYADRLRIDCKADDAVDALDVQIYDVDPDRVVDLPIVHTAVDDIDLGVEVRTERLGARIVDVADEAKSAGLLPGDLVTSINGISMAGVKALVVRTLGFRIGPSQSAEVSVLRGDEQLSIVLRSPARAPTP